MQCIIAKIKEKGVDIISPATLDSEEKRGVGLYPDRVFVQGEFNVQETINTALNKFEELTGVSKEYVNVMHVTIDSEESPIKRLNQLLDTTELCNRPIEEASRQSVLNTITKGYESPLHLHAFGELGFHIPFIAEIATIAEEMNSTSEDIGARRLHTVMENLLEDISFSADGEKREVIIDKKYVEEKFGKDLQNKDFKKY